ncbi:MAG TPA: hypothetical protein VHF69_07700 [Candidatus Synoicihabitans sp.]|nr:hypothetical protein [Candidatus Synoicihabitans sp.]
MNTPLDSWTRLLTLARRARLDQPMGSETAPVGFATRVVALSRERRERPLFGLIEILSWRALLLAGGLATASMLMNFNPALQAFEHDWVADQDPVAVVLELTR